MDPLRPIHVLMIEDSPADVILAREALGFMPNVRFSHRNRLADASAILDGQPVDVTLLDLGLPDSHGLDTLIEFRRRFPQIPVVVLTVRKAEEVGLQALHAGAQDFLVKSDVIGMDVGRSVLYALERSRIEAALRESEGRFRLLVENAHDHAIFPLGRDGRVAGWNAGAARVMGHTATEVMGQPLSMFDPPDIVSEVPIPQAANQRTEWEGWWARRSGERMWVNVAVCKLDAATGQDGFVVVVRDSTERRLLSERLKRAERLEAIGRLAGGVAHDFNNLLTVINGYASMLAAELSNSSGTAVAAAVAVRDAGERAARLTAQLLAYGRRTMVEPKVIDLNSVL